MAGRTPGLQARSQYHRDWGNYATPADLPNAASNAIGAPEFPKLEIGDTAYVTGTSERYFCQAVGTSGGGDAVWAMTAGNTTTRDAHQIVVGSTVNGDVAGNECDFADTGNGLALAQALDAAAALGYPCDIRIRPANITLDPAAITGGGATYPLAVPSGCRVIGAGVGSTVITSSGTAALSQVIFDVSGAGATLPVAFEHLSLTKGGAAGASGAANGLIDSGGVAAVVRISDCQFSDNDTGNVDTDHVAQIRTAGRLFVEDCVFIGVFTGPVAGRNAINAGVLDEALAAEISNCQFGAFVTAVVLNNPNLACQIRHLDGLPPSILPGGVAQLVEVSYTDGSITPTPETGNFSNLSNAEGDTLFVEILGTNVEGHHVNGISSGGIAVEYVVGGTSPGSNGEARLDRSTITGVSTTDTDSQAVLVNTDGVNGDPATFGSVSQLAITAVSGASSTVPLIELGQLTASDGTITNIGVHNCNAPSVCLELDGTCEDVIFLGNFGSLTVGGALGVESAHNI